MTTALLLDLAAFLVTVAKNSVSAELTETFLTAHKEGDLATAAKTLAVITKHAVSPKRGGVYVWRDSGRTIVLDPAEELPTLQRHRRRKGATVALAAD